jgi:hypothetical protein
MPNFAKHFTTGAAVGGGINLLWQIAKICDSPDRPKNFWEFVGRINFGRVAGYAALGGSIASIPDILEPASNPNHRALFHSVACGGAVTYAAFGKHSERWTDEQRQSVRIAAASYLSHLMLDAGTPKSLPLIC